MASGARAGRGPARLLILILGVAVLAAIPAVFVGLRAAAQQPPEELSNAELFTRVARAGDEPPAFGATVTVEQDLIPTQLLNAATNGGGGGNPTLASAPQTARVWYGGEDRARAELLGENGDKVFVKNGAKVSVYDGATNTLRTGTVGEGAPADGGPEGSVSPAEVNELLAEVGETSRLTQRAPTSVGGRQAYSLVLTPKDPGSTLVGRAEALVDAETYLPLQFLLYADGTEEPVLSYRVSGFEAGPVPAERFRLETPPGAQVTPLKAGGERPDGASWDRATPGGPSGEERGREVANLRQAQAVVDFEVQRLQDAPGGRTLEGAYLTGSGGVALAYGSGWGTVVLSQQPEEGGMRPEANAAPENGGGMGESLQLPTVALGGGVEAQELSTPVGTALSWEEDGVSYVLAGSVPAPELARAARGLR